MKIPVAITLLALGVSLILSSLIAPALPGMRFARSIAGHPSVDAMLLMVLGIAVSLVGIAVIRMRRQH